MTFDCRISVCVDNGFMLTQLLNSLIPFNSRRRLISTTILGDVAEGLRNSINKSVPPARICASLLKSANNLKTSFISRGAIYSNDFTSQTLESCKILDLKFLFVRIHVCLCAPICAQAGRVRDLREFHRLVFQLH